MSAGPAIEERRAAMLDPLTRPLKDATLARLARLAGRVSPNTITGIAFLVGIACACCAAAGRFGSAAVLWGLNRVLDGLDGTVARRTGRQTDLGGYIDLVADFTVYAAVPIGVALGTAVPGVWRALALLFGAFYVNAAAWLVLSALLEKRAHSTGGGAQTSVVMPEGLISGTETVVLYFLFLLLPDHSTMLFNVTAGLVCVSALQRVAGAVRRLR